MTRNERIDIATETLAIRAAHLRRMVTLGLSRQFIIEAVDLCERGIATVKDALDSTDDPPPVLIGQGTSQTRWPKESEDGTDVT